ncbi:uncharacterized protein LOC136065115 [Quercus suber]|uniref:uncharacterized protein LOC136065115 n=1 Tax=Quercus suber TaxID=58331 RepID=UPI0032E0274F
MAAYNLVINKLIALVVLLVKDEQHAVQMAYSIIKDLDFSKCSEHKTEALGDFGHFDLIRASVRIRVLQIRCAAKEVIVKHLRCCLEEESDQLKKYKEGACTLHNKVKALTKQVKKLNGATGQAKELMEANAILTVEITFLCESIDKAKADTVEEYKDSHPFFNLLGSQYGEGFEDFRKQAAVLFPKLDISSV